MRRLREARSRLVGWFVGKPDSAAAVDRNIEEFELFKFHDGAIQYAKKKLKQKAFGTALGNSASIQSDLH